MRRLKISMLLRPNGAFITNKIVKIITLQMNQNVLPTLL